MSKLLALILTALILPLSAQALSEGDPLPNLIVENKGELVLDEKGELDFVPWSSADLDTAGQVQIIQYMAARPSSEKQIRPFTDRLEAVAYAPDLHDVITIVNLDDVTFGMSGWALSELEKNKREYAETTMVADWDGKGLKLWNLEPKSSALFILGADGKILFAKDGKLNQQEIEQAIELIGAEVAKRQQ